MAGVAMKANCTEHDINELNKIINGQYREIIKKRATCILLSNQGVLNKVIAEKVGFMPRIVGNWVRRFNDAGVRGLFDVAKPGRRSKANRDLGDRIRAALQETPPDGADAWTASLLANKLGVSVNVVWSECHELGISFQRSRQWTYDTKDVVESHSIEVVGLFCSNDERAIVVRVDRDASGSEMLRGTYATRNKDLADELNAIAERNHTESGEQEAVTLSEILTAAAEHAADDRRYTDVPLYEYLNNLMDVLPLSQHSNYLVVSYDSGNNAFSGLNRGGYTFSIATSKEDWLHRAEAFLRSQCSLSMEEEKLIASLTCYSEKITDKTEPFAWWKRPVEMASTSTETDTTTSPTQAIPLVTNTETAEQPATSKTNGKPRIDVQIKYTDSYGNETSQVLSVTEGLIETQNCDLGSVDSVVAFTENLTTHLVPLMDKATQQLGTFALESVKKNRL